MRIGRISTDCRIPFKLSGVIFVEKTQLFPHQHFESAFVGLPRLLENRDEGRILGRAVGVRRRLAIRVDSVSPYRAREIGKRRGKLLSRLRATEFVEEPD